jgi:starch synthase
MYAMRYGAIPIVTPVGGLRDTVDPVDQAKGIGTGIVAAAVHPGALLVSCEDALDVYWDKVGLAGLRMRAMERDSSWGTSAKKYVRVYEEALRDR